MHFIPKGIVGNEELMIQGFWKPFPWIFRREKSFVVHGKGMEWYYYPDDKVCGFNLCFKLCNIWKYVGWGVDWGVSEERRKQNNDH